MWISRVEDIEAQRDNVQVTNPFMMQNNANSLKSPMSMANNISKKIAPTNNINNEVGVILSISGKRGEQINQATTLSGIDVNLFAAD